MGIRPPVSRKGPLSPGAAGGPPGPQAPKSGCTPWGLNSMLAARRPLKSARTKTLFLRARGGLAQYWASISLQATSGHPPLTIPAFAHFPETGIGTGRLVKAVSTAPKSSLFPDERLPITFSQTAKVGNRFPVASLISFMILIA